MTFTALLFYFYSAVTVIAAISVVTVRNPVHAVLSLVLTFFSSAAIWILMEAEFLGITLVLVYVGAVMVLFIFVVMMLDINVAKMRAGFVSYLPFGLLVAIIMAAEMILVLSAKPFQVASPEPKPDTYSNTEALGEVLYTDYVFSFEIAAVILLVAIVAAIALTMRKRPKTRYQNPSRQIQVKSEERLRLVDIKPEDKTAQSSQANSTQTSQEGANS